MASLFTNSPKPEFGLPTKEKSAQLPELADLIGISATMTMFNLTDRAPVRNSLPQLRETKNPSLATLVLRARFCLPIETAATVAELAGLTSEGGRQ